MKVCFRANKRLLRGCISVLLDHVSFVVLKTTGLDCSELFLGAVRKYIFLPNENFSYIYNYICLTSSNHIRCAVRLTLHRSVLELQLIHFWAASCHLLMGFWLTAGLVNNPLSKWRAGRHHTSGRKPADWCLRYDLYLRAFCL